MASKRILMKYAHYEEKTNRLLGWYDKDVHRNIPKPHVVVKNQVWKEALLTNANHVDPKTETFSRADFRTNKEKQAQAQEITNIEAKQYLSDTDWYVIRFQETGTEIPRKILDARAKAREEIK